MLQISYPLQLTRLVQKCSFFRTKMIETGWQKQFWWPNDHQPNLKTFLIRFIISCCWGKDTFLEKQFLGDVPYGKNITNVATDRFTNLWRRIWVVVFFLLMKFATSLLALLLGWSWHLNLMPALILKLTKFNKLFNFFLNISGFWRP